jgi:manganese transport protein
MAPPPAVLGAHADGLHFEALDLGAPGASPVREPSKPWWRRMAAFAGPGYLVAVGYMDPGNWATGLAAGSAFGYRLLWVVFAANLVALLLQTLSARLGIVSGLDLAQACRRRYGPRTRILLWLLCEAAIVACDIAEVIGAAVALKLLFHLPLVVGVVATALQVLLLMALQGRGLAKLEAMVVSLIGVIGLSLGFELLLSRPHWGEVVAGLSPSGEIASNPAMLYLAVGVVGATVMPHNLYLHSATVRRAGKGASVAERREAIRFSILDIGLALTVAVCVNAAILVLAASTFHAHGFTGIADLSQAYQLLTPTLGAAASTVFAVALLASGQNSALTGVMAGQIVMEGFTDLRMPVWARRLLGRLLAIVPAAIAVGLAGDAGATRMLIVSQVALSMQLPFAVIPLLQFTSDPKVMGPFASRGWLRWAGWGAATLIVIANGLLLLQSLGWP